MLLKSGMANPAKFLVVITVFYCILLKSVYVLAQGTLDFDEIVSKNISAGYSATNFTYLYPELDNWKAPKELQIKYPSYLSGFDNAGRPIWVMEWGKYDIKTIVTSPKDKLELYNTYWKKVVRVISKSHDMLSTAENPVLHANFVIDLEGLRLDQLSDRRAINYLLSVVRDHRDVVLDHAHKIVILNTNAVALPVINIARTVLGSLFERISVFGTNKAKWVPELLRWFPKEALPEWYGGNKEHTPIGVIG